MKIKVLGFGQAQGKKIALAIKKHLRDYPFRFIQKTEISFGYLRDDNRQIIVEEASMKDLKSFDKLIAFLQKVQSDVKANVTHGVNIRFPGNPCKLPKAATLPKTIHRALIMCDVHEVLQ